MFFFAISGANFMKVNSDHLERTFFFKGMFM